MFPCVGEQRREVFSPNFCISMLQFSLFYNWNKKKKILVGTYVDN